MTPSHFTILSRRSRRPNGGRRMVSETFVSGAIGVRLWNWMPVAERLMLSVVRTELSSSPATCMASLAEMRGDLRRSRLGLVIRLSLRRVAPTSPAAARRDRRPSPPAFPSGSRGFLPPPLPAPRFCVPPFCVPPFYVTLVIQPARLRTRRRRQRQLHLAPREIRPCDDDLEGIPQSEPAPRPARAEREAVLREGQTRVPHRALRQKSVDVPLLQRDEHAGRSQPRDEPVRRLADPGPREAHGLPPRHRALRLVGRDLCLARARRDRRVEPS